MNLWCSFPSMASCSGSFCFTTPAKPPHHLQASLKSLRNHHHHHSKNKILRQNKKKILRNPHLLSYLHQNSISLQKSSSYASPPPPPSKKILGPLSLFSYFFGETPNPFLLNSSSPILPHVQGIPQHLICIFLLHSSQIPCKTPIIVS